MIHANELMIGDWVSYKGNPTKIRTIEICNIDVGPLQVTITYGDKICGLTVIDVSMLKPIPLTPEILKKNGFSQDPLNGHIFIFQEKSGEVIYYEYGPKYGLTIDNQLATIQDLRINYVHQLQHALKLCGIEKEVLL